MSVDKKYPTPVFLDLRGDKIRPMVPPPKTPLVTCLGNFDGVHTAHSVLLKQGLALRQKHLPHALCGVFTFFHPSSDYRRATVENAEDLVLRRPSQQRHLTPLREKLALFRERGMEFVCLCDFNELRALPPQDFLDFLATKLGVRGAVCGFNFHFGVGGEGDADRLSAFFDRADEGYFCTVAPAYCLGGEPVSSTRIRRLLLEGETATAQKHLGHPYALQSRVVKGKQLGRTLGFPTANQYFLPESLVPAHGVYAVLCHTPAGVFPGVANVGSHPTVDKNAAVNCETYIIGPAQDLYGYRMRVDFLYRLRDEMQFESIQALTEAIEADAARAEAYIKAYLEDKGGRG